MKPASRRDLLLMMAAAGAVPAWGGEQRKLLPVNTPGIEHPGESFLFLTGGIVIYSFKVE